MLVNLDFICQNTFFRGLSKMSTISITNKTVVTFCPKPLIMTDFNIVGVWPFLHM